MIFKTINFSTNWNNKLDCKCFTTIRLKNPNKYILNKQYGITINNKSYKKAEIVDIKTIFYNQINEYIARLDTGYSAAETKAILKKMYPKVNLNSQPFSFILLATI